MNWLKVIILGDQLLALLMKLGMNEQVSFTESI